MKLSLETPQTRALGGVPDGGRARGEERLQAAPAGAIVAPSALADPRLGGELMTAASSPLPTPLPRRRAAPWFIVEGALLIILGGLAAALPEIAGVAGALVFGWVLVLAGVFGLVSVFGAGPHLHRVLGVISALVALAAGALIVWRPLIGAVTLAIFIGAYLLLDGFTLMGLAWDQRRRAAKGWGWLIVSGVIDIVLAILILAMGPLSSVLLLGFIIAIDLAFAGIALIMLGVHARHAA